MKKVLPELVPLFHYHLYDAFTLRGNCHAKHYDPTSLQLHTSQGQVQPQTKSQKQVALRTKQFPHM
jgi:hypothetical protein